MCGSWACSPSTATPSNTRSRWRSRPPTVVTVLRQGKRKVFAINPMAAARYRDRHSVSRKKSDPGDALVLATILRTDIHAHRVLPDDSELARAIAVLARAQQDSTWSRQQLANQLRSLLREYYPAALAAFEPWKNGLCRSEAHEVLKLAPTPTRAARLPVPSSKQPSSGPAANAASKPRPNACVRSSARTTPTILPSSRTRSVSRCSPSGSSSSHLHRYLRPRSGGGKSFPSASGR
ncbi:hypothetical protein SGRIM119S_07265 [Streptomyces griseorubiginosus]